MALIKEINASNGVPLKYHRIALVSIDTNNQVTILIHSYLSEEARQIEKDYADGKYNDLEPGEMIFPYVNSEYITIDYDPDMTIEKAYRTLKSKPEFTDADDAFDSWNGDGVQYKKGDYISYNNKVYKVLQDHVSQTTWTPDTAVSLYVERPDPRIEYANFIQPTGVHDVYMQGDKVTYNGDKYESLIDNNAWSPDAYPQEWKLIRSDEKPEEGEEEITIPDFVQPTGAHDAYSKGDKVKYNDQIYESLIDNNVWSPNAYPSAWKLL